MKGFFVFLIFMIVIVAIFYGIWKLSIKTATKQAQKANETQLLKMYNEGVYNKRLIFSIAMGVVTGLIGGIYFYYMMKKRHAIMQEELERRNITFELQP